MCQQGTHDYFGFIPASISISVGAFEVRPKDDYAETLSRIRSLAAADGFVHPCRIGEGTEGPRCEVPSMYRLPATHVIRGTPGDTNSRERRLAETGVLVHGLAFLLGVRAQFHDWWFDGRVPVRVDEICAITPEEVGEVLTRMGTAFATFPVMVRNRFVSILYLENRTASKHLYWEQFLLRYTVLDALFRCFVELGTLPRKRIAHHERFRVLAEHGLMHWSDAEEAVSKSVVAMRNDLVHEGLLDGLTPAGDYGDVIYLASHLRRLNQRLLLRLAGVSCGFAGSSWTQMGRYLLELR